MKDRTKEHKNWGYITTTPWKNVLDTVTLPCGEIQETWTFHLK
jgi:hypothetical protein